MATFLGFVRLAQQDLDGARVICREVFPKISEGASPETTARFVLLSTLVLGAVPDMGRLIALAERAMRESAGDLDVQTARRWSRFRAGHRREARLAGMGGRMS